MTTTMLLVLLPLALLGAVTLSMLGVLLLGLLLLRRMEQNPFYDYNHLLASTPYFVTRGVMKLYWLLDTLPNLLLPPPQRTVDVMMAFIRSQVVFALVELGVFDALCGRGPSTAAQLAQCLGTSVDYLTRLLDAATSMRFLAARLQRIQHAASEDAADRPLLEGTTERAREYHLTSLSSMLCKQHPNSLRGFALMLREQVEPYRRLAEGVRVHKTAFDLMKGHSFWKELELHPEKSQQFNEGMISVNGMVNTEALVLDYPWARFAHVVDVGGGIGGILAPLLTKYKSLRGTLFDQPHVINSAEKVWSSSFPGLLPRVTLASGSFLAPITASEPSPIPPPDTASPHHTVYLLRNILHDWPDSECVHILSHIRSAIGTSSANAVLVIAEAAFVDGLYETEVPRRMSDIHMMVLVGGKERNEAEFGMIFKRAGFKLWKVYRTRGVLVLLEAVPVGDGSTLATKKRN